MSEYYPEKYLTDDILTKILNEFEWPCSFVIEDDLPDGIIVKFSQCSMYISEYAEGEVELIFLANDLGISKDVTLGEVISLLNFKDDKKNLC